LAVPLMFAAALVNATGFAAQLALACAARLVTPFTVIVQLAVPTVIDTPVNAIESGAPTVIGFAPSTHPAPAVTVGAAVNLRLDGRLSVNAIPACAGFDPVFASVKTSVVDPASAIETAPNAFVSVGCAAFTTRQLGVTAFATPATPLMLAAAFVNAAGFAAQLALVCAARFVTPFTVIVQLAVPAFIDTPVNAIESGVPTVTGFNPSTHPAPAVTVGAAVNRKFAGRLSVNAIPA
jgi:hypothetical protein